MSYWNIESFFLDKVDAKGGFVCHHAHFDKSHLITEEALSISQSSLQEKWILYRKLKENYTEYNLHTRMAKCIENQILQGVSKCRTFIDADQIVSLLPMQVAGSTKRT